MSDYNLDRFIDLNISTFSDLSRKLWKFSDDALCKIKSTNNRFHEYV